MNIRRLPVLSDQYPQKTFRIFEMPSRKPPTRPITLPPAPSDSRNIGRIGIIISLLRSLRKLTALSKRTLAEIFLRDLYPILTCAPVQQAIARITDPVLGL